MTDTVIKVEGLGKKYIIGHQTGLSRRQSYRRFSDVVLEAARAPTRWLRGRSAGTPTTREEFWALRDVSFDVKKGEVVGIIGRNGAGKSTLLKILSRITDPTLGRIEIDGRVASLLEVGTGFHPELTGRENIFLNGAILGMSRAEIRRKFDEIVAFAEVEKFLDTPTKRYSTGMYVRLAFAVAAHLEPDILVVDEVLAVGDAQFQKKCLGKMQDVSRQDGRTILFVSHNMGAMQSLCSRGVVLAQGQTLFDGTIEAAIHRYHSTVASVSATDIDVRRDRRGAGNIRFTKIEIMDEKRQEIIQAITGESLVVRMHYRGQKGRIYRACKISFTLTRNGTTFMLALSELVSNEEVILGESGYVDCIIPTLPLTRGDYALNPYLESGKEIEDWVENGIILGVADGDFYGSGRDYPPGWEGTTVLIKHNWAFSNTTL